MCGPHSLPVLQALCLLLLVGNSLRNIGAEGASKVTFCERAEASKTCPSPPTFDHLSISSYAGSWFQIGAGAAFTFADGAGLACGRARYTLAAASSNISVVNSGLTVLSPAGMTDVTSVGTAFSDLCSGARAICYSTPSIQQVVSQVAQVADKWATAHPSQASSLSKLSSHISLHMKAARLGVEEAASQISAVQVLLNQINQANGSVEDAVSSMKKRTRQVKKQALGAVGATADGLQQAEGRLLALKESVQKGAAEEEKTVLQEAAEKIGATARLIDSTRKQMKKALQSAEKGITSLAVSGKPREKGGLFKIEGTAVQVNASLSAGKLQVSFFGESSPYWVLAIEGEYKASLVYSCTLRQFPGQLDKSLFILSRTPSLSSRVVARFLSLAYSLGIYSDCDDPFLFTVQRGGTCGQP